MKRLVLVVSLLAAAPALAQQDGMNFRIDFRGQKINRDLFALTGPNAREQMFEEPEGLRIVLPAEGDTQGPTGLVTRFKIRGDFEITTSYEILRADKPASVAYSAGAGLYLYTETPTREAINFGRYHMITGQKYLMMRNFDLEKGKRQFHSWTAPAEAAKGKLRLARKGKAIRYLAAEGDGDEFKELKKIVWGEYDIFSARMAAEAGTSATPVEVRFFDLSIRSGDAGAVAAVADGKGPAAPKDAQVLPAVADVAPPASSRRWILWLVAGLVVVGLVGSGGVWLFLQTRRAAEPAVVKRAPRTKA
jgi:hypothetical protein